MNLKNSIATVFLKGNAMKIKLGLFREKITYLLFFGCLFCASMYMFESYSGMVSSATTANAVCFNIFIQYKAIS